MLYIIACDAKQHLAVTVWWGGVQSWHDDLKYILSHPHLSLGFKKMLSIMAEWIGKVLDYKQPNTILDPKYSIINAWILEFFWKISTTEEMWQGKCDQYLLQFLLTLGKADSISLIMPMNVSDHNIEFIFNLLLECLLLIWRTNPKVHLRFISKFLNF